MIIYELIKSSTHIKTYIYKSTLYMNNLFRTCWNKNLISLFVSSSSFLFALVILKPVVLPDSSKVPFTPNNKYLLSY